MYSSPPTFVISGLCRIIIAMVRSIMVLFFRCSVLFLIVDQITFESNLVRLHSHHFRRVPRTIRGQHTREPRSRRRKWRKEITAHMKEWATASEKKASNPFKIRFIFIVRDLQIVTDRLRQILLCSIKSTTPTKFFACTSCVGQAGCADSLSHPLTRTHWHTFHKW